MEDALVPFLFPTTLLLEWVLILVLMEDALVQQIENLSSDEVVS